MNVHNMKLPGTVPVRDLVDHADEEAQRIRQQAGLSLSAPIDPLLLQDAFNIRVAHPDEVESLTHEMRQRLNQLDASVWSGMARPLPDGRLLVILNPNQTIERARVTVLEEVAHRHYEHPRDLLDGFSTRNYNNPVEREAYWMAAAVLLPAKIVARAVFQRRPASSLASSYGVSVELVEMRIKLLRLWGEYRQYATVEAPK